MCFTELGIHVLTHLGSSSQIFWNHVGAAPSNHVTSQTDNTASPIDTSS